ncbi:PREDICTED: uncharacterized protein LOC105118237 [Populus euphratica]|uniref:Uncharacterized protein LOC105118237 n=1 Tax=Populus euphratica TaxID=75702 RepID=A0AAJ6TPD6_POPEU|nr:PREDICTED: uncharacterized protein LOC105118237 [Populus euphratica]
MSSLPIMGTPYRAAMSGDWRSMLHHYQERVLDVPLPITLSADTALHIAVYSKQEQPLKDLLGIVKDNDFLVPDEAEFRITDETESLEPETESLEPEIKFLKRKNKFGNTALHEATIYGNYEAAKLMVELCPDLLLIRNHFGETPLFTAAGFAEAEIVEFLIRSKPEQCVDDKCRLLSIHRKRKEDGVSILRQRSKDGLSILGAAIIGQHFETALLLLELDESLHNLEDKMGRTALKLLAEMPTGFESGYPMGIFERLIYSCLPVIRHHEVKSQTWCREMKDLESGTLGSNLLNNLKVPNESKMISNLLRCRFLPQGYWPARLERFWNQKRTNVFALRLVKILIKKDESWRSISITEEGQEVKQTGPPSSTVMQGEQNKGKEAEQGMGGGAIKKGENELSYLGHTSEIISKAIEIEEVPLLIAARNGIEDCQ